MKYLIAFFAALFLTSCSTQNQTNYSKITYEAGACFGFCPMFKLTINPDRTAIIDAERFTFTDGSSKDDFSKPREGIFKATIDKESFAKLNSFLDSLNLKSLKNYYGDKNITDLPTSHLIVTFKDGSSKHIEDYGKSGTEKLREFYEFIENLRKTQKWTKVN